MVTGQNTRKVPVSAVINIQENIEGEVVIILNNAQINLSGGERCPLSACNATGSIKLRLIGTSTLSAGGSGSGSSDGRFPAIWAPEKTNAELIIENGANDHEQIGSLIVKGPYCGAAIGTLSNGTIRIQSGKIEATGGVNAAGIGATLGAPNYNGIIVIAGGEVKATGGTNAAGIGTCNNAVKCGILISGGKVTVTGGGWAAGIGGGKAQSKIDMSIIGGEIVAAGGYGCSYGLGGGSNATTEDGQHNVNYLVIGPNASITNATITTLYDNGFVFNEGSATLKGSVTLSTDIEIPNEATLTIPEVTALIVPEGITFTNSGTITNNGTIVNKGTINGTGSVTPKAAINLVKLTAENILLQSGPFTYTGSEITPEVTLQGSTKSFTSVYANNTAVGTATVTVTMDELEAGAYENGDYWGSATKSFEIKKATPTAELFTPTIPENMVYKGESWNVPVTFGESTDGITVVYFDSEGHELEAAPTNAGYYTFGVDLTGNDNFENTTSHLTRDDWHFTIAKADPTFAVWRAINNKTFDMSLITNITAPALTGVVNKDPIATDGLLSYTYYYVQDEEEVVTTPQNAGAAEEGAAPVFVGRYKVKAKFLGNNNYNELESTSPLFSITKVYPSFSSIEVPQYAVYDGATTFTATANVKGVVADETQYVADMAYEKKNAEGEFEPLDEGALPKEAGEYRAIASFTHRNYMGINTKLPFSIQPKPLSATTATLSEETFTYNGTDQQPTVTEVKEGETTLVAETDYTVTGPEASAVAGSYAMTITGRGNYQGTFTKAYTIAKATPTPTAPTGLTAIFGKTLADVTLPPAEDGAWSWQTEATTSVGSVGTQTFKATFTPTDAANYNVVKDVEVTITVTEKGLDEATIQFERASISLMKGSIVPANALTKPADCTVTYSSDNEKVATVDAATGVVTVVGVGTTTITATATGDYSGSASYTLTITQYVPTSYTVTIPDHVTGAIIVGGGTRKVEENGEVTFRIELDPNGNGQYPTVTTSNGMTLTHDGNGNYRFQAMGDTQVMIGEVPGYSYYMMSLPQQMVAESDSTFWSAEGIEVVGATAVPAMRAVSDSETSRFMAPFGTTVTLRPIETAERKFLQWENGSTERERTLTLRADEEIRVLWQRISPTGIEAIAANSQIRGERGQLCIEVPVPCDAVIYNYNGVPVRMAHLTEGSNRIYSLPAGLYLVQIGQARAVPVRVR